VCRPLAPSHADACNPLMQAHPTWARDKHEGHGFPLYACLPLVFPLRAPSGADPSGLGYAATIYSSVQGPPRVETPTGFETSRYTYVKMLTRRGALHACLHERDKLWHGLHMEQETT
jgi:hypothetical protein